MSLIREGRLLVFCNTFLTSSLQGKVNRVVERTNLGISFEESGSDLSSDKSGVALCGCLGDMLATSTSFRLF